jgi:hypothetical protein
VNKDCFYFSFSRAPWNFFRFARIFPSAWAANHRKLFLPAANASGDGLNGLIAEQLFTIASVVAIALLKLTQESRHAERTKRIGQRLATGGSQFSGIERVSFHLLSFV